MYPCIAALLLALPISAVAQSWKTPAPTLKPLPTQDVPLAKRELAKIVGEKRSAGFVVAKTDCPFDDCTDVVEREIRFEEYLPTGIPTLKEVNSVGCFGRKKDQWQCFRPLKFFQVSTESGVHDIWPRPQTLDVNRVARILDYLQSDCYRNEFADRARVRKLNFDSGFEFPYAVEFDKSEEYLVSLGPRSYVFVQLVLREASNLPSQCEFTVVDAFLRRAIP